MDHGDSLEVWDPEEIPPDDHLYYRVPAERTPQRRLQPSIFHEPSSTSSMSMDWSKYRTPRATVKSGRRPPETYGVVTLGVGHVRSVGLEVCHTPDVRHRNQAHCDVCGLSEDKTKYRVLLFEGLVRNGDPPEPRWTIPPQVAGRGFQP